VVIDIEDTELSYALDTLDFTDSPVKQIRHGQREQDLRVVLDLHEKIPVMAYTLQSDTGAYQLILTLENNSAELVPTITVPENPEVRDVVVIIDPGHGGHDPGAIGMQGLQEKDIVLSIAQELQSMLNTKAGVSALLTRDDDYYVTLRQRLDLARNDRGDVFISIHADAFKESTAYGASVFTLSEGGASSEAAYWLAQKENYSELGGVNLAALQDDDLLRSVLIDLSQTATINASMQLGSEVLQYLQPVATLHNARVGQAGFLVLKSPDIPSVLIETGFISNLEEELKLGSEKYRQQVAQAIYSGITSYIDSNLKEVN